MLEGNMLRILLTNDDGIDAPGLKTLERAMAEIGEVYVVAPLSEQSGTSRGITLRRPLRFRESGNNRHAVDGTPADSVMMALCLLLDFHPDLVVSGINNGPNLGENVFYSGTVAGAAEAAKHGIPAIAVSVTERENLDFRAAAEFTAHLGRMVAAEGLPKGVALNVNVPHPRFEGVEITRQCEKISRNVMIEGRDPRGRPYYWIDEEVPLDTAESGTDYAAIREGKVSITPLRFDNTAEDLLERLQQWCSALSAIAPAPAGPGSDRNPRPG
jgi:5'-nucleotidase